MGATEEAELNGDTKLGKGPGLPKSEVRETYMKPVNTERRTQEGSLGPSQEVRPPLWGWLSREGATASSQVGSEYFHQNDGGGWGAVRDGLAHTGEGWRSQEARGSGHVYTFSTRP